MSSFILRTISIAALVLAVGAALSSATARGQDIFVVNGGNGTSNGTIGEYTLSGGTVNVSLVSGLSNPVGIAASGSNLFVTNYGNGTIGEYTMSGATVNATLVFGLNDPFGLVVSGSNLFVANGNGTIGEYTTSGAVVNASLFSGLGTLEGLAVSGSDLFVVRYPSGSANYGTVGEYTTSGAVVNAAMISNYNYPYAVAVSGSNMFVTFPQTGSIGEYTTSGAVVNVNFIANAYNPNVIAMSGSNLFVTNSADDLISEFTTSGALVNLSLVSGLSAPRGILLTAPPVSGTWSNGSGGNWSVGGNWSGGNVPGLNGAIQSAADTATFAAAATSGSAVTVTLDTSPQVSTLTFSSTGSYVLQGSGTNVLTLSATGGLALVAVSAGTQTIAAPLVLASSANFAPASGTQLTLAGAIGGTGGLSLTGAGLLVLSGTNNYTGGTTVSAGTLQGTASSLQGSLTDNATLVFNQVAAGTFGGTINGTGTVNKSGSGQLTFSSIDAASCPIAVNQGVLVLPGGLAGGGPLSVSSGGALQATGLIGRAVAGAGTIAATGDLIIGNSQQAGQFNQGGGPGVGGTLNIGGNAFAVFSSSTAILGSQTNIGAGGSLTALNGAQLGNPTSVDATKILTATGNATINANFVNNGVVNGPTGSGQELKFTQAVQGAGSTTGNIEYAGSYQVGNSPDAVSVQNVLFDPTSTLIMEFAGDVPGSGYDQLDISGLAALNGVLDVDLLNGFSPSAGEIFHLFNGQTTGSFSQFGLPSLGNGLSWDTSNLDTNGTITVTPEPSSLALLAAAGAVGLVGYGLRRRATRRTAKSTALDQGAPAILSFPSHSSLSHAARRAA